MLSVTGGKRARPLSSVEVTSDGGLLTLVFRVGKSILVASGQQVVKKETCQVKKVELDQVELENLTYTSFTRSLKLSLSVSSTLNCDESTKTYLAANANPRNPAS